MTSFKTSSSGSSKTSTNLSSAEKPAWVKLVNKPQPGLHEFRRCASIKPAPAIAYDKTILHTLAFVDPDKAIKNRSTNVEFKQKKVKNKGNPITGAGTKAYFCHPEEKAAKSKLNIHKSARAEYDIHVNQKPREFDVITIDGMGVKFRGNIFKCHDDGLDVPISNKKRNKSENNMLNFADSPPNETKPVVKNATAESEKEFMNLLFCRKESNYRLAARKIKHPVNMSNNSIVPKSTQPDLNEVRKRMRKQYTGTDHSEIKACLTNAQPVEITKQTSHVEVRFPFLNEKIQSYELNPHERKHSSR
ncbi:hypothetical protein Ciccas_013572, partial [Cichlidogyrus casuarinus]